MDNPHNVCNGGCGAVSDKPGVCQKDDCSKHNQPLQECNCTDGKHGSSAEQGEQQPNQ